MCVHDVYRVTTCRPGRGHIVTATRLDLVIRSLTNHCFILNEIQQEHEHWMVTETVVFVDTVFSFTDISVLRYAYSFTALLLQCIAATVNFINLFILAVQYYI